MTLKHIAIICDGNRRWAKRKGLPEFTGHKHAVNITVDNLVDHAIKLKIPYLTFWALSTENWKRGKIWMNKYFKLMHHFFNHNLQKLINKGVKVQTIGDLAKLPQDIQNLIKDLKKQSKNNKKITVVIAINYGGQDEIIRAINKIIAHHLRGGVAPAAHLGGVTVTKKDFEKHLDTKNIPNPDLLIRPGDNNTRLSNFMLWQIAYSQLYFTNTLFPDFTPKELDKAITWYHTQTKNIGK